MNAVDVSFIPLLVVLGLSFLVPIALSRVRRIFIPIVIGEIAAGMVIGPSGLGIVEESTVLRILSELGFAFLMFLCGLEIDFAGVLESGERKANLWRRWLSNHLVLGVSTFALTLALAVGSAFLLSGLDPMVDPWIMSLILATTSLGVVAPVLKERGFLNQRFGQLILASAMVADFLSIFLVSIYVLFRSHGIAFELLLALLLLAAFVVAYRVASLFRDHLPAQRLIEEISSATSQIKLRGALALALVFIVLAETLGIEVILGSFLAGFILSLFSDREDSPLREKLDAVGYGFFIPIFFIMVGVSFDLPALLESREALLSLPLLLIVAYAVKLVPALLYRVEHSWRETLSAGVLMSSRLSLLIAAAAIGLDLGAISEAVYSAIILVAVVTCTLSPLLFNALGPEPSAARDLVLVVGCARFAELLTQRLQAHGQETVLLCTDLERNPAEEVPATEAKRIWVDSLRKAGSEQARCVVVMEEADEDNLQICRMLRVLLEVPNVICWVQDPARNPEFQKLGVRVINPVYSTLLIIEGMVLNPEAISGFPDVDEHLEIREVKLKNPELAGANLSELLLPQGVAILMVRRGDTFLVADRNTVLAANDVVTVAGSLSEVEQVIRVLQYSRTKT
jgi:Kef-type K+ transport system membrane component KefB/Trk K+ transport system NAD-binding subunit